MGLAVWLCYLYAVSRPAFSVAGAVTPVRFKDRQTRVSASVLCLRALFR